MRRSYWIEEIRKLSGNFGNDYEKLSKELSAEIDKGGIPVLIDHLRLCGSIPESYDHDSSEEKLYSKYTDCLLSLSYNALGLKSIVLKERADAADHSDLAELQKIKKDFKVQAITRGWKRGKPNGNGGLSILSVIYQLPRASSQIYQSAKPLSLKKRTGEAQELLYKVFKTVPQLPLSKNATDYWLGINKTLLEFSIVIEKLWQQEKQASLESIEIAKEEDLTFLAKQREKIMRMSHEEALDELVKDQYSYPAADILQKRRSMQTAKPFIPDFYDAHAHFFLLGELLDQIDLMGSKSFEEVITRLQVYHKARPEKKWIIGGGWDQNLWKDKKFPTKELLDKAFPDIPVFLSRIDYHAAVVNSEALRIAKVNNVRTIEGGLIGGRKRHSEWADYYRRCRLTHMQLEMLKNFYKRDELKIRDYAMIATNPENVSHYLKEGVYDTDRLTIRSFKLLADGALGSRGACLLEHYHDAPTKGFLLHSPAAFDTVIRQLANSPFQVNTHAIGDSANGLY
ncbi:hypothetical protein FQR65_LT18008 [Abscondita terminalis]|nr:hypothetical protein FQR65_LT18008 [Abscondita terminalis]